MKLTNTHKILIGIGSSLLAIGGGYLVYNKFFKKAKTNSNFEKAQENLNMKAGEDNIIIAPFMSNNKKFYSQFYTNNRIIIFGEDKKIVSKGTYFDGGRTIVLDNGKQSSDESVWKNLLNLVSNDK